MRLSANAWRRPSLSIAFRRWLAVGLVATALLFSLASSAAALTIVADRREVDAELEYAYDGSDWNTFYSQEASETPSAPGAVFDAQIDMFEDGLYCCLGAELHLTQSSTVTTSEILATTTVLGRGGYSGGGGGTPGDPGSEWWYDQWATARADSIVDIVFTVDAEATYDLVLSALGEGVLSGMSVRYTFYRSGDPYSWTTWNGSSPLLYEESGTLSAGQYRLVANVAYENADEWLAGGTMNLSFTIPEPSAGLLAGLAGLAVGLRARRRTA